MLEEPVLLFRDALGF